jgi:hypothetical protein
MKGQKQRLRKGRSIGYERAETQAMKGQKEAQAMKGQKHGKLHV